MYSGQLHLENDCASVVSQIIGVGENKSAIAGIVADIRVLLESMQNLKVSKVNRTGNEAAHILARLGNSVLSGEGLIGSNPPYVDGVISRECNQTVYS